MLSNIYLNLLDYQMAQAGHEMTRSADDFVIQCRTRTEAEAVLEKVCVWVEADVLRLHPEKTRIVDATQPGGFDFLGYHFERGYRWPRSKSLRKLKDTLRAKTQRTNGRSMPAIMGSVSATLRGWFGYFRHSHWTTCSPVDKWVRMRLRSILRRRRKKHGRGRTKEDHQRWPNAYFAGPGLFSLVTAHAQLVRQSHERPH